MLVCWLAWITSGPQAPWFDTWIRTVVPTIASPGLTGAAKFLTFYGAGWLLYPASAAICLLLWRKGRGNHALRFAVAVTGAVLLEQSLKALVHRPRPQPFFGYPQPNTYSFPSGHALISLCFYLALAEIEGRKRAWRLAAVLFAVAIGLTRIYLGVHYPTDVAAGFATAIAWLSLCKARFSSS